MSSLDRDPMSQIVAMRFEARRTRAGLAAFADESEHSWRFYLVWSAIIVTIIALVMGS